MNQQHKLAVLYSLYKPLLNLTKKQNFISIKNYIKFNFKLFKLIRNTDKIRLKLIEGYDLLSDLHQSSQNNLYSHKKLTKLNTHLSLLHQKSYPTSTPPSLPQSIPKKTPNLIFSTPYNPPLPRIKPQPNEITMLLFKRRKLIQKNWNSFVLVKDWQEMIKEEEKFLGRLGIVEGKREERMGEEWREFDRVLREGMNRDTKRGSSLISPRLNQDAIKANKEREKWFRERKERGRLP